MKDFFGKLFSRRFFYSPIFIVGCGRSGTTVLLQAMGKHPHIISMPGEAPFITSMAGAAYLFEYADNKDYYLNSIRVTKDYLYKHLRRLSFEVAAGKNYGLKMSIKEMLRSGQSIFKKRFWCAKTFPNINVYKGLCVLYPEAKFIYIVRNGCDVVQSMTKFSGFYDNAFEEHCKAWVRAHNNFGYLQTSKSGILVRHEHLVEKPDEVFEKVFSFIGIEYYENSANFVRDTLVHPLDKPTQSHIDVKTALCKRRPSYENWTQMQKEMFKSICGDTMNKLGYEVPF